MREAMIIKEPEITRDEILMLKDPSFTADNVCIVTDCGAGVGRAAALASAANNLMTVGLDINEKEGKKTQKMARDLGGQMIFIRADLGKDEDVDRAVADAAKLGKVKYLVNIAGIQHRDSLENFPMEKYDLMQRLMVRAPFYLSKLVISHMRRSGDGTGVIGNMASIHAQICTVNRPVYNIAEFGLRALSQSIAMEGAGKIRSFTVSTGFVKTPSAPIKIPARLEQRGVSQKAAVRDVIMGKSQMREMMAPVEAANLFLFGFSRFSKCLVGGNLMFDGGVALKWRG